MSRTPWQNISAMKKILLFIGLSVLMLVGVSGYNHYIEGSRPGLAAPLLRVANADTSVDLQSMRGQYVLLSLWASSDAASRELCNRYAAWDNAHRGSTRHPVEFLSLNFDENPALFRAIVRTDSLNPRTQFHIAGRQADSVRHAYHIRNTYGTLLINPEGRVVAVNPALSELNKL